jgi:hypothetical protein
MKGGYRLTEVPFNLPKFGSEFRFGVFGGFFHTGEDGAQFIELRAAVEGFKARVGEHLEEPGATSIRGGVQF